MSSEKIKPALNHAIISMTAIILFLATLFNVQTSIAAMHDESVENSTGNAAISHVPTNSQIIVNDLNPDRKNNETKTVAPADDIVYTHTESIDTIGERKSESDPVTKPKAARLDTGGPSKDMPAGKISPAAVAKNTDNDAPEAIVQDDLHTQLQNTGQGMVESRPVVPAATVPATTVMNPDDTGIHSAQKGKDIEASISETVEDAGQNEPLPGTSVSAADESTVIAPEDSNPELQDDDQDTAESMAVIPAAAIPASAAVESSDNKTQAGQKNTGTEPEFSETESGQNTGQADIMSRTDEPATAPPAAAATDDSYKKLQGADQNTNRAITGDIFGKNNRHIRGFFSVSRIYKSNLYKTDSAPEDVWATFFTPGIWISVPSSRKRSIEIFSDNASPGGLAISPFHPGETRTFQSYLLYSPQFEIYHDSDVDDLLTHRADGYFYYRWNKLSLRALDQFKKSHDWITSRYDRIDDTYKSNLFNTSATYDPTRKLQLRLDYSNFCLDYDDARNRESDRIDNSIAAFVFFRLTAKSSVFFEYDFSDIDYDTSDKDSQEHRYFGGFRWEITDKSSGQIKGGFGKKEFDDSSDSATDWMAEIQIDHNIDSRTKMTVNAYRRYDEVLEHRYTYEDTEGYYANYIQAYFMGFSLTRDLTAKIHLCLDASLFYDEFKDGMVARKERKDTDFKVSPSINYDIFKWMTINGAYIYTDHDSNYPNNDYIDHTAFIRASVFF